MLNLLARHGVNSHLTNDALIPEKQRNQHRLSILLLNTRLLTSLSIRKINRYRARRPERANQIILHTHSHAHKLQQNQTPASRNQRSQKTAIQHLQKPFPVVDPQRANPGTRRSS
ncbi:hypothetical protein M758_11G007500 [Ceratodon purpureus]|nr:hypothetical protein M758_11G007500 [Ceratodon purpureus]